MRLSVFIFSVCVFIYSCSAKQKTNVELGNENQILYYGNGDEPKSLDPHLTTGSPDNNIILNLFEGLMTKDPKTLEPKPGVAESWTLSEDRKVYTFNIRKNAKWSNGDSVTADDFVYSWKRALSPNLPNHYAYMMFYIKNAESYYLGKTQDFKQVGVKALSSHQLQITLHFPAHFFLQLLDHHSYYPIHKATIERFGSIDDALSRWALPENFVGNGAFTLKNWEVNKVIEIEKSKTYWDKENVILNGAHFFPIEDQQAEERAFRSGQIHLTNTPQMDIEKIAVYKKNKPESIRVFPTYSSYYYEFNVTRKPFDDVRVRQALSMAVDRSKIVNYVTKGGEKESYNFIPNDPVGFQPKTYFKYDVKKAQDLLAEAGYPNGEGFPVFHILYNTHDNHRKVALAIQQMLKESLNIDVRLENKEWKVYMAAKKNLEHDMARAGWIADYLDPSNFFDILRSYAGNNNTGWNNSEYDQIMKQLDSSEAQEERYRLFEEANKLLAKEMPVLPIYYYSDLNLVSPDVQGWYDNPMHYHSLKGVSLNAQKNNRL